MSTATDGRRSEHLVRDDMARHGWTQIMRAAGSKGAGDLLLGHPEHGAALTQVGRGSKRLGPVDRARLLAAAELIGALPLLAVHVPRRGIRYWVVTDDKPGRWPEYRPEQEGSDATRLDATAESSRRRGDE